MLVAGQLLAGRFELRRLLGAGAMGEVFAAWDQQQREIVALKSLTRADPQTVIRFKKEFRALQGLSHPNLVQLHELVRDGDRWFLTMELIRGVPLMTHVRPTHDRFVEPRLRDALGQLTRGVRALHAAGLVHRDIKPSNVMVTSDERVVLLDFGLVTGIDPRQQSSADHIVGTIDYMAPEQALGRNVGEASDWYAVGVMLHEMLTGHPPYSGHAMQVLVDKQQLEVAMPPGPEDLATLARDLLAIEPARRPRGGDVAMRLGIDDSEMHRTNTISIVQPSSVFVGRDDEIARLVHAVDRAPSVQLLVGESGIGKSALVDRVVAEIGTSIADALVLRARCYERESVPYKAFDGVADGIAGHLLDEGTEGVLPARAWLLPRLFPVLQRVAAIAGASTDEHLPMDPVEQRRETFAALRGLVTAIAERRPVVITIDDLQWADADSFVLLRELLRPPDPPRVTVIATVRSDGELPAIVRDGLRDVDPEVVRIGPLDDAQCRELAAGAASRRRGPLDVDRLLREAQGHPMFLLELVRHTERVGDLAESPRLEDALWARIELLREPSRALIEVVCLAGGPIVPDVAMAACKLDAVVLGRAIASLKVASLVREVPRGRGLAIEPYHDRVREAVVARIPAERQRELHAALASALEMSDERDPNLMMRHHLLAGAHDRAAAHAETAATRATAAHAFDQAAILWRQALELVPHTAEDARRLRLRLGEALIGAGHGAEAAEHFLIAATDADPAERLELRRIAAEQLLISGHIERGVDTMETLLREIGVSVAETPRRALWSLLWHRGVVRLRGLGFRERHRREIADIDLLKIEALKAAAHGLAVVDAIRGSEYQARCLRLSLTTGGRFEIARAILFEAMFQSQRGNLVRAKAMLDLGRSLAPQGDPYFEGVHAGGTAVASYFAGELAACVEASPRANDLMRRVPGTTWERASIRIFWLWALRFIGEFVELRKKVDEFLRDAEQRGDLYMDSTIRRSCASLWMAEDTPEIALAELARARWVPPSRGFHVQHFHELTALGELSLYGAAIDPARIAELRARLEGSLLTRIRSVRAQVDYLDGRLAAAGGEVAAARAAARALRKGGHPLGPAWAACIEAAIADDQTSALETVAREGDRAGLRATAAVARRALALQRGEDPAVADVSLAALGVKNPARFAQMIVPRIRRRS